jgi:hypothetical protein
MTREQSSIARRSKKLKLHRECIKLIHPYDNLDTHITSPPPYIDFPGRAGSPKVVSNDHISSNEVTSEDLQESISSVTELFTEHLFIAATV